MRIKVYATPTCPYCKLVKDFLTEKGEEFNEIDVSVDHTAATEMVKMSGQMGVPVIDINGKIIVGWNRAAIEDVLDAESSKKKKVSLGA